MICLRVTAPRPFAELRSCVNEEIPTVIILRIVGTFFSV